MNNRLGYLCQKQNWLCKYCGRAMSRGKDGQSIATLDEVHPRSRGGRRTLDNQVAACKACNNLKGSMSMDEFERFMLRPEFQAKTISTNAERRRAKKEQKALRKQERAGVEGRWTTPRMLKPPADLDALFKASLGDVFPAPLYKRDASFDDSMVGAQEHNSNEANIARAIRGEPHHG